MNLHIVNSRALSIIISLVEDGADIDKIHKKTSLVPLEVEFFKHQKPPWAKKLC